jgi:hypothetical protein
MSSVSDKKERKLTETELTDYIANNRAMTEAKAAVMEKEADLEVSKAEEKRARAKTMRQHAALVSRLHLLQGEIIDEATGDIKPGPEPTKG